jgi:toxin ParE1/3/4
VREVRLTPRAVAEIADIRSYTRRAWGTAQAAHYVKGLGRRFQEIAAGTVAHRDAEIDGGYRRCRYEFQVIVFKEERDFVRIVHVFHERMDIPGRASSGE